MPETTTDALTAADAVADVANTAGENVTTAIRSDLKEFKTETDTRFAEVRADLQRIQSRDQRRVDGVASSIQALQKEFASAFQSLQRENATIRWMIGIGFTLLSESVSRRHGVTAAKLSQWRDELSRSTIYVQRNRRDTRTRPSKRGPKTAWPVSWRVCRARRAACRLSRAGGPTSGARSDSSPRPAWTPRGRDAREGVAVEAEEGFVPEAHERLGLKGNRAGRALGPR